MATVTPSFANIVPKDNVVGDQTLWIDISISATTSAGDVIRLFPLPHGAVVHEFVWYAQGAAFVTDTIHKMGISSTDACYLASDTYSTGIYTGTTGLGVLNRISVSDAAVVRYEWVLWTPTSVITAGAVGSIKVRYSTEQAQPGR